MLLALQMSLLACLSTVRISQVKMHLRLSEAYGRAQPVPCRSEWMGPLKLWLRSDDLVDHFEVFAVHVEERGCLPVYFIFLFLLKCVFKYFSPAFFSFSGRNFQGRGKKLQ